MWLFHRKPNPLPEGVSKPVAWAVKMLQNRLQFTDARVHAALSLPALAKTPQEREFALKALRQRLQRAAPLRRTRSVAVSRIAVAMTGLSVCIITIRVLDPFITQLRSETGSTIKLFSITLLPAVGWWAFAASIFWLTTLIGRGVLRSRENAAEVRAACARSLGILGDDSLIPLLAKYAHDDNNSIAYEARRAIQRLLPALARITNARLTGQASQDLARLLPVASSAADASNILRALSHAGSPEALPHVELYSRIAYTEETTLLSCNLIAVLRQRAIDDAERMTLLRPASAHEDGLLRPVGPIEADPAQLLRVAQDTDAG